MFLWSAYMNNEKSFVIEILVLRVVATFLTLQQNYSILDVLYVYVVNSFFSRYFSTQTLLLL